MKMTKTHYIIIVIVAILGLLLGLMAVKSNYVKDTVNIVIPIFPTPTPEPTPTPIPPTPVPTVKPGPTYEDIQAGKDYKNATYLIEGQLITLQNGQYEDQLPNSSTKVRASIHDEKKGDLNGDGQEDVALILTYSPGGTGTYYYVAGSLSLNGEALGTEAIKLGDRLTSIALAIEPDGTIKVSYSKEKKDETGEVTSQSEEKYFRVELPNKLVEVKK